MTADPETRAYRRLNELKASGKDVSYDQVSKAFWNETA